MRRKNKLKIIRIAFVKTRVPSKRHVFLFCPNYLGTEYDNPGVAARYKGNGTLHSGTLKDTAQYRAQ